MRSLKTLHGLCSTVYFPENTSCKNISKETKHTEVEIWHKNRCTYLCLICLQKYTPPQPKKKPRKKQSHTGWDMTGNIVFCYLVNLHKWGGTLNGTLNGTPGSGVFKHGISGLILSGSGYSFFEFRDLNFYKFWTSGFHVLKSGNSGSGPLLPSSNAYHKMSFPF